jgi:hypothetical protein
MLLVLLILVPSATPVVAQTGNSGQVIGQPELDIFTNSKEFEPGTTAELRLAVSNRGQIVKAVPHSTNSGSRQLEGSPSM